MIEAKERRWIWIFALIVLAITTVPYLIGYWAQGSQWVYNGFVFGVQDGNSYIAKMLEGASGDWLFRTPYTAYPQNGAFAFFPYLLLGKLSAGLAQHAQLVFLFQAFRWLGGFLLIFAIYDFAALFIKKIGNRRLATGLITLGGGLGWLSVLGLSFLWQGRIPLEFYSPETYGFLSLLGLPHLEVARACLLWGIKGYLVNIDEFSIQRAAKNGLLWLVMGLFQPLTVLIGWVIIGCHLLVTSIMQNLKSLNFQRLFRSSQKQLVTFFIMVLVSSPIVVYTFISFQVDPFLRGWTDQNLILSPPIGDYILAFLNILPFSIAGIVLIVKTRKWNAALLAIWLFIFPILAYAPYNLQRRLPEGIWVAIVILGLIYIEERLIPHQKLIKAWLMTAFISSLLFFVGAVFTVSKPGVPLYAPAQEIEAFTVLNANAKKNDVVLASFDVANELPAWLPVRTVVGHGPESINSSELLPRVEDFFKASTRDNDRLSLIDEFGIKYVILGPDKQTNESWDPQQSNFAQLIFRNASYQVYAVVSP